MLLSLTLLTGAFCNSGCSLGITAGSAPSGRLALTPTTASISIGEKLKLEVENPSPNQLCGWRSSADEILSVDSGGTVTGVASGVATIRSACGLASAEATVAVSDPPSSAPIQITKGGVYSGNWKSNDPSIAPVTVMTTEPVTITNSTVTGPGLLIRVFGRHSGHLTVSNVTGVGIDPKVSGLARGAFLYAEEMDSLVVTQCTMRGTSSGIVVVGSTPTTLSITHNLGINLDDRVSDGAGGTLLNKRSLGHFIHLNQVVLQRPGEIAWNQIINAPIVSSIEDIFNIYNAGGGGNAALLSIHDNYLEGAIASGQTTQYTGVGIQFDGASNDPSKADGFALVTRNVVVRTAGGGISIGAGHDITIRENRVVSCGQDGLGNWQDLGGGAFGMWNYYKTQQFYNNTIAENTGGLIEYIGNHPRTADMDSQSASAALSNVVRDNHFDDPCWVNGEVSQAAEATERQAWMDRLEQAHQVVGDTH